MAHRQRCFEHDAQPQSEIYEVFWLRTTTYGNVVKAKHHRLQHFQVTVCRKKEHGREQQTADRVLAYSDRLLGQPLRRLVKLDAYPESDRA